MLEWSDPKDTSIIGYRILRGTNSDDLQTIVSNTGAADNWYLDLEAAPQGDYVYAVRAVNPVGESGQSQIIRAVTPVEPDLAEVETVVRGAPPFIAQLRNSEDVPAKPTGIIATRGADRITVTWDDPDDDTITGYSVIRYTRHGTYLGHSEVLSQSTGDANTQYVDTAVSRNVLYYQYRIYALNPQGASPASDWSGQVSLYWPEDGTPRRPMGLDAFAGNDRVVLSWRNPHDSKITGYRVLRGSSVDTLQEVVANTSTPATRRTDTGRSASTLYVYAIEAINDKGRSQRSAAVSITTSAAPRENTLVSNLGNKLSIHPNGLPDSQTSVVADGGVAYQSFSTGSNAAGYNLLGVVLNVTQFFDRTPGDPGALTAAFPSVAIYSETELHRPDDLKYSLTAPSENDGAYGGLGLEFHPAGSGATLDANTSYVVAIHASEGRSYRTAMNRTGAVNSAAAEGWTIPKRSFYFDNNGIHPLGQLLGSARQIAIIGTAKE